MKYKKGLKLKSYEDIKKFIKYHREKKTSRLSKEILNEDRDNNFRTLPKF
jgi:hypothetical protein